MPPSAAFEYDAVMDSIRRRKLRNLLTNIGFALLLLAAKVVAQFGPPLDEGPRFDVPLESGHSSSAFLPS